MHRERVCNFLRRRVLFFVLCLVSVLIYIGLKVEGEMNRGSGREEKKNGDQE